MGEENDYNEVDEEHVCYIFLVGYHLDSEPEGVLRFYAVEIGYSGCSRVEVHTCDYAIPAQKV